MKYSFTYKIRALDILQLQLYNIYGSYIGVCNIIFTVSVSLLAFSLRNNTNPFTAFILCLACFLFPVIQPLVLYIKAKKIVKNNADMEICFDDIGIHVSEKEHFADISWTDIKKIDIKPTMLIIYLGKNQIYILSNFIIGKERDNLCHDILTKLAAQKAEKNL